MKVLRLIFRQTGTYNDQYHRPYESDFSDRIGRELADITRGGMDIAPSVLAGVAGRVIRPSSTVGEIAAIGGGWDQRRFLFIMEVEVQSTRTSRKVEVITGVTNYDGITRSKNIDEKMELQFTSAFTVQQIKALGANGAEWSGAIHNPIQILNQSKPASYSPNHASNGTISMRPEDLFVRQTRNEEIDDLARSHGYVDMRSGFSRGPLKASRRSNTQAPLYLSTTLKAHRDSDETDFISEKDDTDRFIEARGMVREMSLENNAILTQLQVDTDIMTNGFVTYGELLDANPDLDKIADVYLMPANTGHRRGDTDGWSGGDTATVASVIISNAVPTILMSCMYTDIRFTATNDTRDGSFVVKVSNLIPFVPEADIHEHFDLMLRKIENELLRDLALNNEIILKIDVRCSIYEDTEIFISVDGGAESHFVYPTMCDSLISPIITDNIQHLDLLAKDIGDIASSMKGNYGSPRPSSSKGKFL